MRSISVSILIVMVIITTTTSARYHPHFHRAMKSRRNIQLKHGPPIIDNDQAESRFKHDVRAAVVRKIPPPGYAYAPIKQQKRQVIDFNSNNRKTRAKITPKKILYRQKEPLLTKHQMRSPAGFGEPPLSHYRNNILHNQGFGEPPLRLSTPLDTRSLNPLHGYNDIYDEKSNGFPGSYSSNYYGKRPKNTFRSIKNYGGDIVGGQYAEPPARFVSHTRRHSAEEKKTLPALTYDSTAAGSSQVSSYVNYKNSNMAFSPQNLNDVFGLSFKS